MPGDKDKLLAFKRAATRWEDQGKYFGAAYAMDWAINCAWGKPDEMQTCALAAFEYYRRSLEGTVRCSLETLAALKKMAQLHWRSYLWSADEAEVRRRSSEFLHELAERLVACYATSDEAESDLVRGLIIHTDLNNEFSPTYPDYEVDWQTETWDRQLINIKIPSAFQLFIVEGDYYGAQTIVDRCPGAFTTPSLGGWKAAVRGFLRPETAVESFQEAADAFAEDRCPEPLPEGRSWSSTNIELWSPYFQARSVTARAVRQPQQVSELIARAAQTLPIDNSGWHNPEVSRFAILIGSLAQLLTTTSSDALQKVQEEFSREMRISGRRAGDELLDSFLALSTQAFEGFQTDPHNGNYKRPSSRRPENLEQNPNIATRFC